MRKAHIWVPAVFVALLAGAVAVRLMRPGEGPPVRAAKVRPGAPGKTGHSEAPASGAPAAARRSAPPPPLSPPVPQPASPATKGQVLGNVALAGQVQSYVTAALAGDEVASRAIRQALLRSAPQASGVVRARLESASSDKEQTILEELLRWLR